MKKFVILIILLLIFESIQAQFSSEQLLGRWQCYHRELKDGNTGEEFSLDGNPYSCDTIIEFEPNKIGKAYGSEKFTYELNGSILRLGNRLYTVEELTECELVLLEYSKEELSTIWNFRQRFKKLSDEEDSKSK